MNINLMALARFEQQLKWIALGLGILSTIAIIRDWYPWTMFISLPFCLIVNLSSKTYEPSESLRSIL